MAKKRTNEENSVVRRERTIIASTPIPLPEILEGYRKIKPDLPDLIIEEWQKEAECRRECEKAQLNLLEQEIAMQRHARSLAYRKSILGMFMGMVFYLVAFGFCGWLIYAYHEIAGAIVCAALPIIGAIVSSAFKIFGK